MTMAQVLSCFEGIHMDDTSSLDRCEAHLDEVVVCGRNKVVADGLH